MAVLQPKDANNVAIAKDDVIVDATSPNNVSSIRGFITVAGVVKVLTENNEVIDSVQARKMSGAGVTTTDANAEVLAVGDQFVLLNDPVGIVVNAVRGIVSVDGVTKVVDATGRVHNPSDLYKVKDVV